MMSSTSGPARFDASGTFRERLTIVPGAVAEERLAAAELEVLPLVDELVKGCLLGGEMGIWLWGLEPKPIEGDIFSHPCRAEPVMLEILCMSGSWSSHVQNGRWF